MAFESLYLIEIPHQTTTFGPLSLPCLLLYLIEIPHQTTTAASEGDQDLCCILSKFHIKPQPYEVIDVDNQSCILSKFHIKPQPTVGKPLRSNSCILSKFHIKPQRLVLAVVDTVVVSYRNSTSNHN